jgi:protein involved in polysaccharide export with SLBB domain
MAVFVLLTSLVALLAQAPAGPAASATGPAAYRVGPGDVLEVNVPGRPDLSRLPTVQTTGAVFLPLLNEVAVEGLTMGEIRGRLTKLLAERDVIVQALDVRVREYQSHFVWVRGEVNRPGRKPLRAGSRLVDALVEAGGFSGRASGEVTLERQEGTFPDGSRTRRFRFRPGSPTQEDQLDLELPLHHRDVVTASLQRYVTVGGAVARPGRYALDNGMTVSRVISTAGGSRGGRKVTVQRQDPTTGITQSLEVDLKAVESGKEPDMELLPDDAVSVKGRRL